MKPYLRILAILVVIYCGTSAILQEWGPHYDGLLSEFAYIPHFILVTITCVSIIRDSIYYKYKRNVINYSVSIIGLIFCFIIGYKMIQYIITDNSKTVYRVLDVSDKKIDMIFDFKGNNHFYLTELGRLGNTIYYGTYSLNNDTLIILESNFKNETMTMPTIGVIRNDTVYWDNLYPMPIDKTNKP